MSLLALSLCPLSLLMRPHFPSHSRPSPRHPPRHDIDGDAASRASAGLLSVPVCCLSVCVSVSRWAGARTSRLWLGMSEKGTICLSPLPLACAVRARQRAAHAAANGCGEVMGRKRRRQRGRRRMRRMRKRRMRRRRKGAEADRARACASPSVCERIALSVAGCSSRRAAAEQRWSGTHLAPAAGDEGVESPHDVVARELELGGRPRLDVLLVPLVEVVERPTHHHSQVVGVLAPRPGADQESSVRPPREPKPETRTRLV
eukprot:837669-Rhodomonas_salina.1